MGTYQKNQELEEVLWSTPAPVLTMINGDMVRIAVKGACSLEVEDPDRLEQNAADEGAIRTHVRSILSAAAADIIGSKSRSLSSVADLQAAAGELGSLFVEQAAPGFSGIGLTLVSVTIHAVEAV